MIFDIIRFNQFALDLLAQDNESEGDPAPHNEKGMSNGNFTKTYQNLTIGEYLDREGYSTAFADDYLIPMTAAVWSTGPHKTALEFPAVTLVRFLWNHHLLSTISARPPWRTIPGGTKQYIEAVLKDVPSSHIHLSAPIKSITQSPDQKLTLHTQSGEKSTYDHVILATHAPTTLSIISETATDTERSILSAFETNHNTVYLHSSLSLMPQAHAAWSAWNYLTTTASSQVDKVSLTYCMNILQHLPFSRWGPVLVTMNPPTPPPAETIQAQFTYDHPLYTTSAIRSQKLLPKIQNSRGISYCGAWTKYGFHEDGFSSGLRVATEHLGAELPFEFVDATFMRGKKQVVGRKQKVARTLVLFIQSFIGWLDWLLAFIEGLVEEGPAYVGRAQKNLKAA